MIVVSTLLLFAFLCLMGASLLPAGWIGTLESLHPASARFSLFGFTALGAALLTNYLLVMLAGQWVFIWSICLGAAILGLGVRRKRLLAGIAKMWTGLEERSYRSQSGFMWRLIWIPVAAVLIVLFVWTVSVPIGEWDPRSIWYFHAKLMYYSGGFFKESGFTLPALAFSQPDYPNMLPAIGAQAAALFGMWNEYLPKISLLVAQIVVLLGLIGAARTVFEAALLICGIVIFHLAAYTTGYMDIYLAAFSVIAVLMLSRTVFGGETQFFLPGMISCGLLPALKNEGYLAALIIVTTMASLVIVRRVRAPRAWILLVISVLVFIPGMWWAALRKIWQVQGWANFNADYIARIHARLTSGGPELMQILDEVGRHGKILSSAIVMLLALIFLRRIPPTVMVCVFIGIAYAACLGLVYLGTPSDVLSHLVTSASRTALTVQAVLYAGVVLALSELRSRGHSVTRQRNASEA